MIVSDREVGLSRGRRGGGGGRGEVGGGGPLTQNIVVGEEEGGEGNGKQHNRAEKAWRRKEKEQPAYTDPEGEREICRGLPNRRGKNSISICERLIVVFIFSSNIFVETDAFVAAC